MLKFSIAILLMALSQPAVAQVVDVPSRDKGYYFNKPNTTVEQFDSDDALCAQLVKGTSATNQFAPPGLFGALVGGMSSTIATWKTKIRNQETCMLIRGWREVYLTSAQITQLKSDIAKNRMVAMSAITGAEPVTFGTIGMVWRNNYAEPVVLKNGAR